MPSNSDVKFYLSGGNFNNLPASSLGGSISIVEIEDGLNNLFDRVTIDQSKNGITNYRSFYIVNETNSILSNVNLSLTSDNYAIGMIKRSEIQRILIGDYPVGGTFVLNYKVAVNGILISQNTNNIQFDPSPNILASNIQNALNSLTYSPNAVVSGQFNGDFWICLVNFSGFKQQHMLELTSNNLLGSLTSISISSILTGSPINAVSSSISIDTQIPNDVEFDTSFSLGDIEHLDTISLWMKRIIDPNTEVDLFTEIEGTLQITTD